MSNDDPIIDEDWSFYLNIKWREILLVIGLIIFIVYLFRKKRKEKSRRS